MKNKVIYFLTVFILFLIMSLLLTNISIAAGLDIDSMITDMSGANDAADLRDLPNSIDIIFSIIRYAGTGISLIVATTLGIKYMLSSVETKAEIKKQAIPVLVGCIFVFGASNLASIVYDIAKDL